MDLNSPSFIFYFFLVLFCIIYIVFYLLDSRKIKKNRLDNIMLASYVEKKFKIKKTEINYKKEIKWMALINSFIISSVGTVVSCLDTYIFLKLGLGFILLFLLIYALYEIYGRHLVRKIRRTQNEF